MLKFSIFEEQNYNDSEFYTKRIFIFEISQNIAKISTILDNPEISGMGKKIIP